jgi:glycosyltransferase involved in cell wall biosynthesis
LHRRFPFDLIHAHFTYPDGVVACLLGRKYGVPVVITEHSLWLPWMEQYPLVRRQAVWAANACAAHLAVSESLRQSIVRVTGHPEKVQVLPNAVDGAVFRPASEHPRKPGQILFVGAARHAKGVDLLLRALPEVRRQYPGARLVLAGDPFYASYRREAARLKQLARDLGIADSVAVVGGKTPAEVAKLMAESTVVVLPSRRETFGAVLIEALACGTPVVATRCGGPEEVVTPAVGMLVPPEDPPALAAALVDVLEHPSRYAAAALREYALSHYGMPIVARQLADVYAAALARPRVALSRVG